MSGVLADERMSDVDALVWNVEQHPQNRTTIAALVRFRAPLDADELRYRVDRASRVIPRLRQRVVADPLPLAPPRWSIDPSFDLGFHLRRHHLADGSDEGLARIAGDLIVEPFDRSRPLWKFTHLTGAGGGDALLLKSHHAVTDGVGGIELLLELFDFEPGSERATGALPPPPLGPTHPAGVDASLRHELDAVFGGFRNALDRITPIRSMPDLVEASRGLGETLGSAGRMFTSGSDRPVVPAGRSAGLDLRFLAVPLDDLRAAGARIDGTINDAFVTAVAVGIADHFGPTTPAPLRISIPINTRVDASGGGNHWAPGRINVDLTHTGDIPTLMTNVRSRMRQVRREPAHALLGTVAAALRRLPASASASLFASFSSALDVAASNVPGSPTPLFLCGQEVDAMIPFGPLSGCGVNVTLLSHGQSAHIGVASDPAAVADPDGLAADLRAGFAAVIRGSSHRSGSA